MNTTSKGNKFEERVFKAIKLVVEEGGLGLAPNSCQIFRKKGYYSKDRQENIITDISIELRRPGATDWSILWVCECKDVRRSVPVDDVEEFNDKLRQIAGKNVKGVMVVSGSMSSGALSVAHANGIGVIRLLPSNQVSWIMEYKTLFNASASPGSEEYIEAITKTNYQGINSDFYAIAEGFVFSDWKPLIRKMLMPLLETNE